MDETKRKAMSKEKDVKEEVKRVLKSFGDTVWWFMPVPTGFGVQGVPDFVCCIAGRFVGIETKFGSNGLTPYQIKQMNDITKAYGAHMVINEKNVGELRPLIESIIVLEEK